MSDELFEMFDERKRILVDEQNKCIWLLIQLYRVAMDEYLAQLFPGWVWRSPAGFLKNTEIYLPTVL